ncbi:PREDICTED: ragulator complex protein LAMTOR3-A [Nicrophorus vespilloides]|uniref:Ragulator complex protein LAMTOR3-A n=1 Tax=Nicrophorus vespilloides TaxID=110193 RepID=A0ABM1MKR5_NICVS|nr:PREDICTED: ragulator complex protein LAMTOR3-A [Nicrophorus vespilloides]
MADEVKKVLLQILNKVTGLYCIIISDRDGVPILKVSNDKAPEMRPSFISTFGLAIDQGSKLGLGKTKTLICSYAHYQVVQMNKLPLIVSFVASDTCNTGHVLALEQQIEPILNKIRVAVAET